MAEPRRVYLDWAATTPIRSEVALACKPYFDESENSIGVNANTNSLHTPGRQAFKVLEDARLSIASSLDVLRPDEIIFTSGATEANNAAIYGLVFAAVKQKKLKGVKDFVPHIITTQIEHSSVLEPCKVLKALGCEITYLKPNKQGFISTATLSDAFTASTVLTSIQMVNNEIGSVQPVQELSQTAHNAGSLFHIDAVQALGKVPLSISKINPDALSVSAHKVSGPKGVGALYLKARTPFDALIVGGGQENNKRSGTHNVAGVVGLATACQCAVREQEAESKRLIIHRDFLYEQLSKIDHVYPTIDAAPKSLGYAPHIVSVCVEGIESETMILRLDEQGYAVSGGSACSSNSLKASRVLHAIDVPTSRIQGALRISMGHGTTSDDIASFSKALQAVIAP